MPNQSTNTGSTARQYVFAGETRKGELKLSVVTTMDEMDPNLTVKTRHRTVEVSSFP